MFHLLLSRTRGLAEKMVSFLIIWFGQIKTVNMLSFIFGKFCSCSNSCFSWYLLYRSSTDSLLVIWCSFDERTVESFLKRNNSICMITVSKYKRVLSLLPFECNFRWGFPECLVSPTHQNSRSDSSLQLLKAQCTWYVQARFVKLKLKLIKRIWRI